MPTDVKFAMSRRIISDGIKNRFESFDESSFLCWEMECTSQRI